jgi:hypothetical protein
MVGNLAESVYLQIQDDDDTTAAFLGSRVMLNICGLPISNIQSN